MFCTRSRKKILDGTSFFDPAPPATGYQEREMDPLRSRSAPPPSDLTRLSEANNGVFPISRVHEVIDGRIERLVHGTRDMPVWGDRYMQEMISPESRDWVSKEWNEAIVRRRILALVEYISTLQRATRRSR